MENDGSQSARLPGTNDAPVTTALTCYRCHNPLRKVRLAGHYKRAVELDVCEPCTLIWFEGTESIRLAGPGVIDLVKLIHDGLQRVDKGRLVGQPACPQCQSVLKEVKTQTRFGQTKQLHCQNRHGYYQTYVLYLAEKGYVRPFVWNDLKRLEGRTLFCAGCGAGIEARGQLACPYCQSTVGLVDPARLASAVDIQEAASADSTARREPSKEQVHCWSCGASVDPSSDVACRNCKAVLHRDDTELALIAISDVEASVRKNYEHQLPVVSRAKLEAQEIDSSLMAAGSGRWEETVRSTKSKAVWLVAALATIALLSVWVLAINRVDESQQTTAKMIPTPPVDSSPGTEARVIATGEPLPVPPSRDAADEPPTIQQMFSTPPMECDSSAPARSLVRIDHIVVVPGAGAQAGAKIDEIRSAYKNLSKTRDDLERGEKFEQARERYNGSRGGADLFEGKLLKRGELPGALDNAAFCLPVNAISPVLMTKAGLHLLRVTEAR
jgi:hypothetical protein